MSPDFLQQLEPDAARLLALLIDPFVQPAFQGSVFWWPYLLSAVLIAYLGFRLTRGPAALGDFRRRYFSRRIWAHPSSQADYGYYIVNSILYPVIVMPLIVSGAAIGGFVERGLVWVIGPVGVPLGVGAARVLYTLAVLRRLRFRALSRPQSGCTTCRCCGSSTRCTIPPRC